MTAYLGKNYSFGLLCESLESIYQIACVCVCVCVFLYILRLDVGFDYIGS